MRGFFRFQNVGTAPRVYPIVTHHHRSRRATVVAVFAALGASLVPGSAWPTSTIDTQATEAVRSVSAVDLPSWKGQRDFPAVAECCYSLFGDAPTGCVWLTARVGPHSHVEPGSIGPHTRLAKTTAVLWPAGYTARFVPLRVYNANGKLVWTELEGPRQVTPWAPPDKIDRIPRRCRAERTVTYHEPYSWS